MWRIMGIVFFNDKDYFCLLNEKRFDREAIIRFCKEVGIAIFDTATAVIRQKDNASDKFLEIVESTDIKALLDRIPNCHIVVTTGEKASATLADTFDCAIPQTDTFIDIHGSSLLRFYRMPSSSRAYPMKLEKRRRYIERCLEV